MVMKAYPFFIMLVTMMMMMMKAYPLFIMLVTMSMGRGKMMVEFFSAETEFNVCKE